MPGRTWTGTSDRYRYDFNGKESDKELSGGAQDYGSRAYDTRIGRFFSVDPKSVWLPNQTPYCFASNNPILYIEKNGEFPVVPGPFNVTSFGSWFRAGYVTSEDRIWKNVTHKLTLAAMELPGTIIDLSESAYKVFEDSKKAENYAPDPGFIRDIGKEVSEKGVELLEEDPFHGTGAKTIGKFAKVVGPVFTAYDVINEVNSNATREERLTQLTLYVAQLELNARISPSTEHGYLDIPNTQFSSPQEAQDRLNEIYNSLDVIFTYFDLTDDFAFKAAKNFLGNTPGLNLNFQLNYQIKVSQSNRTSTPRNVDGTRSFGTNPARSTRSPSGKGN